MSMRVAQVIDSLQVGGAEMQQLAFARAARSRGVKMSVVRLREKADPSITRELDALGAEVVAFPMRGLRDPKQIRNLIAFLREGRYDLLHTHLAYANIIGSVAGRIAGLPVVATLHSATDDPHIRRSVYHLEKWALRYCAHRVIAVGPAVAAAHAPGLGGRLIDVVPNAVAPVSPLPPEEREAMRASLVGDASRPLVISVGRLSPPKGYPDLMAAFAGVVERHRDAALVLVGDGPVREELETLRESLGLAGSVWLLGQRDDVRRLLAASDLYVNSSHWEGLPLSILEAMSAGLPVVATSVGDIPEVVGAVGGVVVPPGEPEQLARAISELLEDQPRMISSGVVARRYIAERHSLSAWFDQIHVLYEEVIARWLTEGAPVT
jgi:glycosyltransferase involved in cell wall biosynthesis